MILYYTGTGNSRYAAEYIGDRLGDEVVDLFSRIRDKDYSVIESATPFVICVPTYCWQIPHIVRDWLKRVKLTGSNRVYFVMTCGGEVGNAEKYLKALCSQINMEYMGLCEVLMPENYIALFDAPDMDKAATLIANAEPVLDRACEIIKASECFDKVKTNAIGRLYSSIVNVLFYPLYVKDRKFTVSDECIGCGVCEKKCVMNNIKLVDGKPQWQGSCTHCMACISYCPKKAIEYGEHSKGLNRYTCKEYK